MGPKQWTRLHAVPVHWASLGIRGSKDAAELRSGSIRLEPLNVAAGEPLQPLPQHPGPQERRGLLPGTAAGYRRSLARKILLKIWFLQDSHHYFVKFLNRILPQGLDFLQIMVLSCL